MLDFCFLTIGFNVLCINVLCTFCCCQLFKDTLIESNSQLNQSFLGNDIHVYTCMGYLKRMYLYGPE